MLSHRTLHQIIYLTFPSQPEVAPKKDILNLRINFSWKQNNTTASTRTRTHKFCSFKNLVPLLIKLELNMRENLFLSREGCQHLHSHTHKPTNQLTHFDRLYNICTMIEYFSLSNALSNSHLVCRPGVHSHN